MAHWRCTSSPEEHPDVSSFISFSDLQPSRYALSYIEQPNERAYHVEVAFIAVDSENLGELDNDQYHKDFGDNKFPYFKGNTNVQIDFDKSQKDDDSADSDDEEEDSHAAATSNIDKFIPPSIQQYTSLKML